MQEKYFVEENIHLSPLLKSHTYTQQVGGIFFIESTKEAQTKRNLMTNRITTRRQRSARLVIAGGGDGGHVFPGIAVAQELRRLHPDAKIVFFGTPKGIEADIIENAGFHFEALDVEEPAPQTNRINFQILRRLPGAVLAAMKLLKQQTPKMILGTGGYVSVPVLYAGYLLRIPTMILESNRQPALANRLLSRSVDKIAVNFEESTGFFPAKKVMVTGNPVRREFFVVGETPPPNKGHKLNILVLGGGRGARSINYSTIAALDHLQPYREQLSFTHQSGSADFKYVNAGYQKREFRADVAARIDDLPKMYARAHLVIGGAGASMVAEIEASGRSAILIPYSRNENDTEEELNAMDLKNRGIAQILSQKDLSGTTLSHAIRHILEQPEELAQIWPNSGQQQARRATHQVAEACLHLVLGQSADQLNFL